ncbi:MAG: class I SAM-dependent methyltransferase, partial [Lysobacterales bacterium]
IAFGLRNVTDKAAALAEMRRVLRPGGKAMVLEFSQVQAAPLKPAYDLYSFSVLPWLGRTVANDADSYRYLAESIRKHPDQDSLAAMMSDAGLEQVGYRNLLAGIVAIHYGWRF